MLPIATKNEKLENWNIQGVGLPDSNNKAGSASRPSALSEPRRADTEQTPSKPRADLKRMQIFEKQTPSRPQANSKRTWGPLLGSALMLGWIWSLL